MASISTEVRVTSESRMNSSARPTSVRKARTACHSCSVTRWRSSTPWIASRASATTVATRWSVEMLTRSSPRSSRVLIGIVEDPRLGDLGMHAVRPLVTELALGELDGLLDRTPRGGEVDVDEPAVVLDHAAVDEHGVHVRSLRLERDVAVRLQDGEHDR